MSETQKRRAFSSGSIRVRERLPEQQTKSAAKKTTRARNGVAVSGLTERDHILEKAVFNGWRFSKRLVTPEYALFLLQKNRLDQRSKTKARVRKHRRAFALGLWKQAPDFIWFDTNDELMNGQKRLLGLAQAGVPTILMFVEGVDPDLFTICDDVESRKLSQFIKLPNANAVGSGIRHMWAFLCGTFPKPRQPGEIDEQKYILEAFPRFGDSLAVADHSRRRTRGSTGLRMFLHFYYSELSKMGDRDKASWFFERLGDLDNVPAKHPVQALNLRLTTQNRQGERLTADSEARITVNAVKAHMLGNGEIAHLKVNARAPFPLLEVTKTDEQEVLKRAREIAKWRGYDAREGPPDAKAAGATP